MSDASLEDIRILSSAQTAEALGYSVVHFRRLLKAGAVPPPIKIGLRKLGWRRGDIVLFVKNKGIA